jgi:beta-lactamase regulating signal transducer with metallopeptidase domain
MITAIPDFVIALARNSAAAGVLVLLVLAVQRAFARQLPPAWRCALWLVVVARLLPFSLSSHASVFNLLPHWDAGISAPADAQLIHRLQAVLRFNATTPTLLGDAGTSSPVSGAASMGAAVESASGLFANWTWPTALFAVWLAGVLCLGSYVVWVSVSLSRRLAHFNRIEAPAALDALHDCCRRMRVRRAPDVICTDAVRTPALHGLLRPRLLLPIGFTETYSVEEQRFVFLHELAHLRRRDLLVNWVMTGLQILHWFNPLVWLGFARWRADREIACDAAALDAAGPQSNQAYGRTMLRLLQNLSIQNRMPGLVGILEDKRQLHHRMKMIANFTPARRPFTAAGLLAILALGGLTDARVAPTREAEAPASNPATRPTLPAAEPNQPDVPHVLLLVNGSASMAGDLSRSDSELREDARAFAERGRSLDAGSAGASAEERRAAPNWQRTVQALQSSLTALAVGTAYRVVLWHDGAAVTLGTGTRDDTVADGAAIDGIVRVLRNETPSGAFDLEAAFESARLHDALKPERIILFTDGLPTAGPGVDGTSVTEAQRITLFRSAIKVLPPRVPVHTVLLPGRAGDPAAAGLYWELANATRGALTCPAQPGIEPRTHVAFVIDTSGSMRDPNSGGLWPAVIHAIEAALDSDPRLSGVQLLDGDGRFILGRRGTGVAGWLPNTLETRDEIKRILRRYDQDTVSNPVPGIANAIRFLQDKTAPDFRMGIYILGDEFNSSDPASIALDRIDALNPPGANGRRAMTISAIGFPTTIRFRLSMGNTGLRFANLMRLLTLRHDGSFVALPEL